MPVRGALPWAKVILLLVVCTAADVPAPVLDPGVVDSSSCVPGYYRPKRLERRRIRVGASARGALDASTGLLSGIGARVVARADAGTNIVN